MRQHARGFENDKNEDLFGYVFRQLPRTKEYVNRQVLYNPTYHYEKEKIKFIPINERNASRKQRHNQTSGSLDEFSFQSDLKNFVYDEQPDFQDWVVLQTKKNLDQLQESQAAIDEEEKDHIEGWSKWEDGKEKKTQTQISKL